MKPITVLLACLSISVLVVYAIAASPTSVSVTHDGETALSNPSAPKHYGFTDNGDDTDDDLNLTEIQPEDPSTYVSLSADRTLDITSFYDMNLTVDVDITSTATARPDDASYRFTSAYWTSYDNDVVLTVEFTNLALNTGYTITYNEKVVAYGTTTYAQGADNGGALLYAGLYLSMPSNLSVPYREYTYVRDFPSTASPHPFQFQDLAERVENRTWGVINSGTTGSITVEMDSVDDYYFSWVLAHRIEASGDDKASNQIDTDCQFIFNINTIRANP